MFDPNDDILKQARDRARVLSNDLEIRRGDLERTSHKTLTEQKQIEGCTLLAAAIDAAHELAAALDDESEGQRKARNSTTP